MQLTPQRRHRILHAQLLHHQGKPLNQIADQLDVSRSTVHDDLQHFHDHYPDLAHSLTQTLTITHALSLNTFLEDILAQGPLGFLNDQTDEDDAPPIPPDRLADIHKHYLSTVAALFREQRLALRELQSAARSTAPPNLALLPNPEQLLGNLLNGLHPPDYSGPSRTTPNISEHLQHPRPDTNPSLNTAPAAIQENPLDPQPTTPQNRAQRRRAQRASQRAARKQRKAV